jgi:cell division protein FtsI/penicillin-binding protein 2
LGIGAGWEKTVGVNGAFAGSIPENTGATDKAAATIGQGRNLTSPLALAVMAGSVARGSAIAPALVTKPAPEDGARDPKALDPEVTSQLRSLMGLVVTEGSAEVLRNVPGGVVRGKTGTAEHGTKNPPETHAWFVGYQGDVAFAVLVETGKSGGTVAAPVAKAFLTNLAR